MTLWGERGAVALRLGSGWCWMDTGMLGGCRATGWSIHILPAVESWKKYQLKILGAVIVFKKADSQQGKRPNPSYRVLPPPSAGLRGFDAVSMRATGAAGAGNGWKRASHARADPIHPHVCQCGAAAGAGQCQLGLLPPAPLLLLAPKAAELAFSQLLRSRTKPL